MTDYRAQGFTLVEMLVVVSIMAILYSMVMFAFEESDHDIVIADANELQSVLLKARSLAMGSNEAYGVIFHIENAGDGLVLKNQSVHDVHDESFVGRHWYALVGPDQSQFGSGRNHERSNVLPPVLLVEDHFKATYTYFTLEDYVEAMENVQIGARHYLSKGVRFLALSDTNELYPGLTHDSYPRPWFGYFDDATGTLYPWGAYNKDIDATFTHPSTGLDYEGFDGPITYDATRDTNVNPNEVWGRIWHHWDFSGNQLTGATAVHEGLVTSPTVDRSIKKRYFVDRNYVGPDTTRLAAKPRPLVNGYWSDFMILFKPDGTVSVARGHVRSTFFNKTDLTKDTISHQEGRAYMGMEFQIEKTGGYAITLCRDVDPDKDADLYPEMSVDMPNQAAYHKFSSVDDAFASISPFIQVFVHAGTGLSELRTNDHQQLSIVAEDLLQKKPYPRMDD